ncbi:hypothetical protein C8R44DRAFT_742874 [Mycena epipterygia]|nr:hypothetical protein C8R44DRAFT_742874 [Mycena epipterygia]
MQLFLLFRQLFRTPTSITLFLGGPEKKRATDTLPGGRATHIFVLFSQKEIIAFQRFSPLNDRKWTGGKRALGDIHYWCAPGNGRAVRASGGHVEIHRHYSCTPKKWTGSLGVVGPSRCPESDTQWVRTIQIMDSRAQRTDKKSKQRLGPSF